jgi:hypothetical protein
MKTSEQANVSAEARASAAAGRARDYVRPCLDTGRWRVSFSPPRSSQASRSQ